MNIQAEAEAETVTINGIDYVRADQAEPVAWMNKEGVIAKSLMPFDMDEEVTPLFSHPAPAVHWR